MNLFMINNVLIAHVDIKTFLYFLYNGLYLFVILYTVFNKVGKTECYDIYSICNFCPFCIPLHYTYISVSQCYEGHTYIYLVSGIPK